MFEVSDADDDDIKLQRRLDRLIEKFLQAKDEDDEPLEPYWTTEHPLP